MGTRSSLQASLLLIGRTVAVLAVAVIVASCVFITSLLDGIDYPEHLRIYPTSPERIHGGTYDEADRVAVWIDDQPVGDATVSEDRHDWEIQIAQTLEPGVHRVRATAYHADTTTTYDETFGVGDAAFAVAIDPERIRAAPGATFNDARVLISVLGAVDGDPPPSVRLVEITQADPHTPIIDLRGVGPLQAGTSVYPAVEVPDDAPPGEYRIGIRADMPDGSPPGRATLIVVVEGPGASPSPPGGGTRPGG
jgi:hypothetical protein